MTPSKVPLNLSPVKEKMLIKVQQDMNREAIIKLLDLEASVIARRSDDFYNSRNTSVGSN